MTHWVRRGVARVSRASHPEDSIQGHTPALAIASRRAYITDHGERTERTMLDEGVTDLPPGMLAAVVTYLEITGRPALRKPVPHDGRSLRRLRSADLEAYLRAFRRLGEEWLWFSRLRLAPAELAAVLDDPAVDAFEVTIAGRPAGLLELDFRDPREPELAFFGLFEPYRGRGHGRWLMDRALEIAFARPIGRLMVHTCSLDHPQAIAFYEASGFRPYKRAVETVRDPRLTGLMPRAAARHVPLIDPDDQALA
jgi:GNAT superfamily N-acetyltransferase